MRYVVGVSGWGSPRRGSLFSPQSNASAVRPGGPAGLTDPEVAVRANGCVHKNDALVADRCTFGAFDFFSPVRRVQPASRSASPSSAGESAAGPPGSLIVTCRPCPRPLEGEPRDLPGDAPARAPASAPAAPPAVRMARRCCTRHWWSCCRSLQVGRLASVASAMFVMSAGGFSSSFRALQRSAGTMSFFRCLEMSSRVDSF